MASIAPDDERRTATDNASPYGASPRDVAASRKDGPPNHKRGPKGGTDPRIAPPPQPRTEPK